MSLKHGYFLEPDQDERQLNRWRLSQSMPRFAVAEGHCPAMIPYAWFKDPIEPETRRVFTCTIRELYNVAQLHFLSQAYMIANRSLRYSIHSNPKDRKKKAEDEEQVNVMDAKRPPESHEQEALEHQKQQKLKETLTGTRIPGLQTIENEGYRIRFMVFVRARVSEAILTSFLETIPDAPPGYASYSYTLVSVENETPERSTEEESGNNEVPDEEGNTQPHSVPAVGSNSDVASEPTSGSDTDTGADSNSASGSENGARHVTDRSWCAQVAKDFLTKRDLRFDKSQDDIHELWLNLIGPFKERRNFFATHAYIILDEQTIQDEDTVLVVGNTDGHYRSRRVDFEALREEIVLKSLETLTLDIHQIPGDWTGVIRGPVMKEAKRLERVDRERKRAKEARRKAKEAADRAEHGDEGVAAVEDVNNDPATPTLSDIEEDEKNDAASDKAEDKSWLRIRSSGDSSDEDKPRAMTAKHAHSQFIEIVYPAEPADED